MGNTAPHREVEDEEQSLTSDKDQRCVALL